MAGSHRLQADLQESEFTSTFNGFPSPEGMVFGYGKTVGNGVEGWAPNAIFVHTDGGAADRRYVNKGTKTTAVWTEVSTLLDDEAQVFGTGSDVSMSFDGTTLNMGTSGFWADCPFVNYPGGHILACEFFDDFIGFADADDADSQWTVDATNGTVVLGAAEDANTPGIGGYVTLTLAGGDNDHCSLKLTQADVGCPFKITKDSGKKLWFECEVMPSSVTDVTVYVGLMGEAEADAGADNTGTETYTDGVCFRTHTGTPTEIDTAVGKDGTETEVKGNAGTLAANTAIRLGIKFDGVNTVTFYINGTALADTVAADATNFPHDVGLTPFFYIKDGEGAAKLLHLDYVKVVQLR